MFVRASERMPITSRGRTRVWEKATAENPVEIQRLRVLVEWSKRVRKRSRSWVHPSRRCLRMPLKRRRRRLSRGTSRQGSKYRRQTTIPTLRVKRCCPTAHQRSNTVNSPAQWALLKSYKSRSRKRHSSRPIWAILWNLSRSRSPSSQRATSVTWSRNSCSVTKSSSWSMASCSHHRLSLLLTKHSVVHSSLSLLHEQDFRA